MSAHPRPAAATPTIGVIQLGRALAAIAVAAFHLSLTMGQARYGGEAVYAHLTRLGYFGVDFFFVLSGFIICHAHAADIAQPSRWGSYVFKRFARVYPFYWLVLLGYLLVWSLVPTVNAAIPSTLQGWLASVFLIRTGDEPLPIQVAWTLLHEVAFYLVFSTLILHRYGGAICLALFFGGAAFVFAPIAPETASAAATYFSLINLQFLFGILAYLMFRRLQGRWTVLLAGLALFGVGVGWGSDAGRLVIGLGLALMMGTLAAYERDKAWALPRWAMALGGATYAIYLTHTNVQGLFIKLLQRLEMAGALGGPGVFWLVLALTVITGYVVHRWVEQPLLAWVRARWTRRCSAEPAPRP